MPRASRARPAGGSPFRAEGVARQGAQGAPGEPPGARRARPEGDGPGTGVRSATTYLIPMLDRIWASRTVAGRLHVQPFATPGRVWGSMPFALAFCTRLATVDTERFRSGAMSTLGLVLPARTAWA
jgi:hypothetical protein